MKIIITESQLKLLIESSDSIYDKFAEAMKSKGWGDHVIPGSIENTKKDIKNGLGSLKSKYENWIVKYLIEYIKKRGDSEIIFDLIDLVKEFESKQNRLTIDNIMKSLSGVSGIEGPPKDWFKFVDKIVSAPKDINSYSPELISKILENLPESKREKSKSASKEVEKIYEDENILIIRPITRNASCKYGANTKWCTAGRLDNRFNDHFDDGILIYYIVKPNVELPDERYRKMASFQSTDDQFNYRWYDSKDDVMNVPPTYIVNLPEKLKNSLINGIKILEKMFNTHWSDFHQIMNALKELHTSLGMDYEWVPGEGWVDKSEYD